MADPVRLSPLAGRKLRARAHLRGRGRGMAVAGKIRGALV